MKFYTRALICLLIGAATITKAPLLALLLLLYAFLNVRRGNNAA